jgi:integrase
VVGAPLTLVAARQLAATALRTKARGQDPAREAQAQRRNGVANGHSFGKAVEDYLEACRNTRRRWRETASVLNGLAREWDGRELANIDGDMLFEQIQKARDGIPGRKLWRKGPSVARQRELFASLSALFTWAVGQRRLRQHPERPAAAADRSRVLNDAELRLFSGATATLSPWHAACLYLLLLTGLRLREASEMRWSELRDGLLVLSGERTKNGREHRLPLSTFAEEIIAGVPRVEGRPYVFSRGKVPIAGWGTIKTKLDAAMQKSANLADFPPWRLHDLRRTVATASPSRARPFM